MVINLKKEIIFQSLQLFFAQFAVAKKLPKKKLDCERQKKNYFLPFFPRLFDAISANLQ